VDESSSWRAALDNFYAGVAQAHFHYYSNYLHWPLASSPAAAAIDQTHWWHSVTSHSRYSNLLIAVLFLWAEEEAAVFGAWPPDWLPLIFVVYLHASYPCDSPSWIGDWKAVGQLVVTYKIIVVNYSVASINNHINFLFRKFQPIRNRDFWTFFLIGWNFKNNKMV
jgi:hypothetical protein